MAIVMPSRDTSQMYLDTNRPWLSIYGTRIRPIPPVGSISKQPVYESSLLHRTLTDELLFEIFLRMSPYTLGRAMCVCRKWNYTIRTPYLWREACLKTWQSAGHEENKRILKAQYDGSWRKMWKQRPRIRCDGIYVSRNTYVRAGVTEWKITNPVHLVCYYRYIRFYPSGRFVYKNSSLKLRDIAKSMHLRASKGEAVYGGRYSLVHDQIDAAVLYPGLRPTVLRIRLRIRGTTIGANNRLDLLLLVTSGLNEVEMNNHEDVLDATENWQENETHNPDVPAVTHRRGLAPFVFVPFEEVQTSVLNAPVDTMDFFVPG